MDKRRYLAPNKRTSPVQEFRVATITYPKSNEKAVIFHHLRPGRQNSEGFGGGYRVMR